MSLSKFSAILRTFVISLFGIGCFFVGIAYAATETSSTETKSALSKHSITSGDLRGFVEKFDISKVGDERPNHTLIKHVGAKEEMLVAQLEQKPKLHACSTYKDVAAANDVIKSILSENSEKILMWVNNKKSPKLKLLKEFDKEVGHGMIRGEKVMARSKKAAVILRRSDEDDIGFFVLSSYPVIEAKQ